MALTNTLNIASLVLLALSAFAILFPWSDVLFRFQLRRNRKDCRDALRQIDKAEADLQKRIGRGPIINDFYTTGSIWGSLWGQRVSAEVFDRMHQLFRKSFDLPDYSLQEPQGILNRQRIIRSFADIDDAIRYNRASAEPRDLRYAALYLLIAGFIVGVMANVI